MLVAAALIVFVLPRIPGLNLLVALVPWFVRLPTAVAVAWLLSLLNIEGLRFHTYALVWLQQAMTAKCLHGFEPCARIGTRARTGDLVMLPSGTGPTLPPMRITGPVRVLRTRAAAITTWRRSPLERMLGIRLPLRTYRDVGRLDPPKLMQLAEGQTIELTPEQAEG